MQTEREVEKIVQENTGLVTSLVSRTLRRFPRLPSGYDREDLHSLGNLGLLNAARTFDPERGVAFSTYAFRCIDHSIVRALQREWNQQIDCVSLSQAVNDEDNRLEDQIADTAPNADAAALGRCGRDILEAALGGLAERQAQLIRLIYFDDEPVREVAQRWRLSTQAVQTLHLRALKALRLQFRRLGIRHWEM